MILLPCMRVTSFNYNIPYVHQFHDSYQINCCLSTGIINWLLNSIHSYLFALQKSNWIYLNAIVNCIWIPLFNVSNGDSELINLLVHFYFSMLFWKSHLIVTRGERKEIKNRVFASEMSCIERDIWVLWGLNDLPNPRPMPNFIPYTAGIARALYFLIPSYNWYWLMIPWWLRCDRCEHSGRNECIFKLWTVSPIIWSTFTNRNANTVSRKRRRRRATMKLVTGQWQTVRHIDSNQLVSVDNK